MNALAKTFFYTLIPLALLTGCETLQSRNAPELEGRPVEPLAGLPEWWERFEAKGLNESVETALSSNPDLEAIRTRLDEVRARVGVESAKALPQASVGGSYVEGARKNQTTNMQRVDYEPWQASSQIRWELDWLGRVSALERAQQAEVVISEARLRDAELALSAATVESWLTLLRLNEDVYLLKELLDTQNRLLELYEERYEAGLIDAAQWGRVQADYADYEQALEAAVLSQKQEALRLDRLRGFKPGEGDTPDGLLTELSAPVRQKRALPVEALGVRPDLHLAAQNVNASFSREEAARLSLYPRLELGWEGSVGASDWVGPVMSWISRGGPRLQLSLLDAGAHAQVRAARFHTDEALALWEGTLLDALREVEDSRLAIQSSQAQEAAATQSTRAQTASYQSIDEQAEAGLRSITEVLEAQQQWLKSCRKKLSQVYETRLAQVEWARVTGGQ